jgi:NAD(P)-dependent dehydrogenase (short-subunit alcohol dehydrogenase family)
MAKSFASVLVTGTTSGVGGALLDLYANSGAKVISVNRRRVPELELRYPNVRFECLDVRAAAQVERLVRGLAESGELPELFILNAGINRVDNDDSFSLSSYRAVMETNLYGALNFVQPLTQLATARAPRHLLAISSMVSYGGNPFGLGYFTSKQALSTCFEVWSRMYAGTDLVFQRVMLGPVLGTAMFTMHEDLPAWLVRIKLAFSASLDGTARAVSRFASTRRRRLFHPWHAVLLFAGMWLCQLVVPNFFRGRKTLAGRARRRAPHVRRP